MPREAQILPGPWRGARRPPAAGEPDAGSPQSVRPADELGLGRMHLGFVVRECAVALGGPPTPEELARWANHQRDERGEYCLFGRPITPAEARVIIDHPGRAVTVRAERASPRGGRGAESNPRIGS